MKKKIFLLYVVLFVFAFPIVAKNKIIKHDNPKTYKMRFLKQSELRRIILKKEFDHLTKRFKNLSKSNFDYIYKQSVKHHINPILILTRLQIEQSLLLVKHEGKDLQTRLNRACGYGTSIEERTGTKRFWGFKYQVKKCIEFYDTKGEDSWDIKEIQTYDTDHKIIIPLNSITAMLLSYAPRYGSWEYKDKSGIGNKTYIRLYKMFLKIVLSYRRERKKQHKTDVVLYFDDVSTNLNLIENELVKNKIFGIINNKINVNFTNIKSIQQTKCLEKIKGIKHNVITNFGRFVFRSFDKTINGFDFKVVTDKNLYNIHLEDCSYKKEFLDYALLKILNENTNKKVLLKLSGHNFIKYNIKSFLNILNEFSNYELSEDDLNNLKTSFNLNDIVFKISAVEKIENLN